jgi:TRAP-type uncharacterized transport system substrate-binding protein
MVLTVASAPEVFASEKVAIKANITITSGGLNGGWNTDCNKNLKPKMLKKGIGTDCQTSNGSIENMARVNSGESNAGYVQTDVLYLAWQNDAEYATNLNPGGRTFINEALMCTTANGAITGFKSFKDFGRPVKIITPPVGSGSEGTVRFLRDNLPGYAEMITIVPQEVPEGDSFSVSRAISSLKSRNPRKRADAVCWVERPTKKSKKIAAVAKNSDLHWIPMDEPAAMDLTFEDEVVYPGVAPVYAGKNQQVNALLVGDTYIYNDQMPSAAVDAMAAIIDQDPHYIDERSWTDKLGGMFSKAAGKTASVAKRAKDAATSAMDKVSGAM